LGFSLGGSGVFRALHFNAQTEKSLITLLGVLFLGCKLSAALGELKEKRFVHFTR